MVRMICSRSNILVDADYFAKKCDLNEFKEINDTYGHNIGDKILKMVSRKLQEIVRVTDTVSRYGGDEFMILLEHIENTDEASEIIEKIKSNFPVVCLESKSELHISISIGYASFPDEGTSFEQLSNLADIKMYDSKNDYYGYSRV
ncbi:diguanylate cyclase [Sulfurimonas aquatica]|uniref:Diguanylate cyclase n=1 Tax=Sulfurimonas aquatica TaxID=2672570 RepID=A0A975B1L9_9BACT|nr:GGDEF domain-containing protein [Sulfurimonas aquatica]QSZ42574.1 diguanylate cyclase [Sulfurimonas aquatica]